MTCLLPDTQKETHRRGNSRGGNCGKAEYRGFRYLHTGTAELKIFETLKNQYGDSVLAFFALEKGDHLLDRVEDQIGGNVCLRQIEQLCFATQNEDAVKTVIYA